MTLADSFSDETGQRPLVLGVLLSGTGRTLQNLLQSIASGEFNARIVLVISSVPGVRGLEIASSVGIPTETLQRPDFPSDTAYSKAIFAALDGAGVNLVLLAGFLRRLVVPARYERRILNIHPALLPESGAAGRGFYGERVHRAVLASGATESGATVHVVDNEYDAGPVVMQRRVPILPGDTPESLATRVFAAECQLYPVAIRRYVADHADLFPQQKAWRPLYTSCHD